MKITIGLLALALIGVRGDTADAKVKLGSKHAESLCPAQGPDRAELTSVSIFEGDPKEKVDLAPDDDRYHGHRSLWKFANPESGKPRDLRLVCTYGRSGYTRTISLAPTVRSCIVERSEKRDDRVTAVKCR
jgi:hypothetical protein